jgi:hypothetical protein
MVTVCMRDEDVLDVLWIEPELLHPADNQFLGVVGIERFDEDDSLFRRQSPRRVNFAADEVKIVEDLGGVGVPGAARRRAGGVRDVPERFVAGVFAAALRQKAYPGQGAEEFELRRILGCPQRGIDLRFKIPLSRGLLREYTVCGDAGTDGERYADINYIRFHDSSADYSRRGQRNRSDLGKAVIGRTVIAETAVSL